MLGYFNRIRIPRSGIEATNRAYLPKNSLNCMSLIYKGNVLNWSRKSMTYASWHSACNIVRHGRETNNQHQPGGKNETAKLYPNRYPNNPRHQVDDRNKNRKRRAHVETVAGDLRNLQRDFGIHAAIPDEKRGTVCREP